MTCPFPAGVQQAVTIKFQLIHVFFSLELEAKRLELLHQFAPDARITPLRNNAVSRFVTVIGDVSAHFITQQPLRALSLAHLEYQNGPSN
jgi:hypothetical protein